MVTDREVTVSNGKKTMKLTKRPLWFNAIEGGDSVDVKIVTSQGYDQVGETLVNSYVASREQINDIVDLTDAEVDEVTP